MFIKRRLARLIEFLSLVSIINLVKTQEIRELEGCIAQTIVEDEEEETEGVRGGWSNRRFDQPSSDPICPVLQCAGPSHVGQHVGGRSRMSLPLVSLRDLPHTCLCTCFI
jgi:hypothetical protein